MAEEKKKVEEDKKIVDKPTNPFRVKPPEGEMMAVTKSTPDGELDFFVASIQGWHFAYQEVSEDPRDWDRKYPNREEWDKWELKPDVQNGREVYPLSTTPKRGMLDAEFGLAYVGFFRALRRPHMRYVKWELPKNSDSTEPTLVRKDRHDSPYFYFQYNMGVPVLKVESKGNFQSTIRINLIVRMINPYKALFLAGGWESLVDAAVHGAVRDHLSNLTIDQIRAEKEGGKKEEGVKTSLIGEILALNFDAERYLQSTGDTRAGTSRKVGGLTSQFGIEILEARFMSFDVVSASSKVTEALEAQEVNRLRAMAAEERAKEIRTLAEAEANAASLLVSAYGSGEAAAIVRAAELQKESLVSTNASFVSFGGASTPIAVSPTPKAPKGENKK